MTNVDQLNSAAVTDRGLSESRPHNEDSYLELKDLGLFIVADGVGGAQAGEVASQMAVEIIGEAFMNMGDADPEDTMRISIERANGAIFQMSQDLPQLASMATTLVVLHISGDVATVAHVGDSRVYRVDADGHLFRETDDHSVVEEEVRAGRMTPEQALVHPSRNVISRALGAEESVDPDIKMLIVHPATTFLLCSDGITRHIGDTEITSLLDSDDDPAAICEKMKAICFERGAEDNLTAVIVRIPGERTRASEIAQHDDADDEPTIASARPEAETEAFEEIPEDTINIEHGIPVAEAEKADHTAQTNVDDDGAYLIEDPEEAFADPATPALVEPVVPNIVSSREDMTADPVPVRQAHTANADGKSEERSFVSKAASAVGLLILGGIMGLAAAYYLLGNYARPIVEAPVLTEQKSNNIPLTSFEETRRIVDADPVKYLNANAATPEEADDFFWLGRALLLSGKPVEAKNEFLQAKNRLALVDDKNAKTMAAEIAMALAIIDSPDASKSFARDVAAGLTSSATDSNANASTNSPLH